MVSGCASGQRRPRSRSGVDTSDTAAEPRQSSHGQSRDQRLPLSFPPAEGNVCSDSHRTSLFIDPHSPPLLLQQAYEELPSEEERRRLLADLTVVGGAKERRVGPELAGRIHRLLTSQNPHLLLD